MLPDAVRVVVLSRSAPPPSFARLITDGAMGFLGRDELDLSAAETRSLARARLAVPVAASGTDPVRARTGGWVAGTVLLLEAPTRSLPAPRLATTSAQQVLFDYFASEILERAPASTSRLLLATALLTEVSASAAESLAREPRAREILADLVRRNCFTVRLSGVEARYRYHPLFREFLLARARSSVDAAEWRAMTARAAEILVRDGRPEPAAEILSEAGAFEQLAQLVRTNAPLLARLGRLATVASWIAALPPSMVESDAWLSYWLGLSCMHDLRRARASLEAAYRAFRAQGDIAGASLAWASCVRTYLFCGDEFQSLDGWIAEMDGLCGDLPAFPSPEVEAEVASSMYGCLVTRAPSHRQMAAWERRALAVLDSDLAAELRMLVAQYPIAFRITWLGDYDGARELMQRVRPLLTRQDVTPLTHLLWHVCEAMYEAHVGDARACFAAVESGLAIARRSGVHAANHLLVAQGVHGALAAGDLAAARRYHAAARQHLAGGKTDLGHHLHLAAWIELCAGDVPRAEEHARESLALLAESGLALGPVWGESTLGHVLVERGRHDEAVPLFQRTLEWARQIGSVQLEHDSLLAVAHARLAQGRAAEAIEPLREGLRLGRERGFVSHVGIAWRRDVMSRLAALALECGIEAEHVRRIVHERGLSPPEDAGACEAWPWPVRIRMLGAFEVWRRGERVAFTGKVQRRPLDLLRALVALGGVDVPEEALGDALWPDADGDSAAHALETAVYRLRKLLGAPGAVVRQNNRLSLDERICWADALALGRQLKRGLELVEQAEADPVELEREVAGTLALYRGALVPVGPEGCDCAEMLRGRLRSQLSRFVARAARHLERGGKPGVAASYLARAREVDPDVAGPRRPALAG